MKINLTFLLKMHSIMILSLALLLQWTQNIEAKETNYEIDTNVNENKASPKVLLLFQDDHNINDLRSIKDVRNNIHNSVMKGWNFIKKLAENTNQKLNTWNQYVKKRANDLTKEFQDQIKHLKERIYDVIKNTFGNNEVMKMCLKKEIPEIDNLIKQIIKRTTVCLTDIKKKPSLLSINSVFVNDTHFLGDLEDKFKLCEENLDNAEKCLNKVRQDNFNDMQDMETDILKTRAETRNILDDLLEALTVCSIKGLLEASSIITGEAVKMIKCIVKPQ